MIPFPGGERFAVVLADSPWNFRTRSAKGRNRCPDGQGHYKVMSLADIKALPVGALTAPNSALFLWVVDCKIPEELAVLAWLRRGGAMPGRCEIVKRGETVYVVLSNASEEVLVIYHLRRSHDQLTRLKRTRLP